MVSSLKHVCGVKGAALSVHAESCDGWINLAAKRTQPTEDALADNQLAPGSKTLTVQLHDVFGVTGCQHVQAGAPGIHLQKGRCGR